MSLMKFFEATEKGLEREINDLKKEVIELKKVISELVIKGKINNEQSK